MTAMLKNARIVLADAAVDGAVAIDNGKITDIDVGSSAATATDLEGNYLLPGLVDIHTDHFERHLYPRAHVRWDCTRAALAPTTPRSIGAGITTVFDSLCIGATMDNPERHEVLAPMIDALEKIQAAGMLRANHLVHLRCELTDAETGGLTAYHIGRDIVQVVSVMEHLPGIRQSRYVERLVERSRKRTGESEAAIREKFRSAIELAEGFGERVRPEIVRLAHEHGLPLLSHDDTEPDHIRFAVSEGISVSEFPCKLAAARLARQHGMAIVAGAPNIPRGGSQSGNVAAHELMVEDLIDMFASDYVPHSLFDSIFMIAQDENHPIELLQVGIHDGYPYLKQVWREGRRVL